MAHRTGHSDIESYEAGMQAARDLDLRDSVRLLRDATNELLGGRLDREGLRTRSLISSLELALTALHSADNVLEELRGE